MTFRCQTELEADVARLTAERDTARRRARAWKALAKQEWRMARQHAVSIARLIAPHSMALNALTGEQAIALVHERERSRSLNETIRALTSAHIRASNAEDEGKQFRGLLAAERERATRLEAALRDCLAVLGEEDEYGFMPIPQASLSDEDRSEIHPFVEPVWRAARAALAPETSATGEPGSPHGEVQILVTDPGPATVDARPCAPPRPLLESMSECEWRAGVDKPDDGSVIRPFVVDSDGRLKWTPLVASVLAIARKLVDSFEGQADPTGGSWVIRLDRALFLLDEEEEEMTRGGGTVKKRSRNGDDHG